MASVSSSSSTLLCPFIFAVTAVITSVNAEEYVVGGAVGWRLPAVNETKLYNVWASRRRFHVGDSLRFRYKPVDSVVVVGKWAFYHCDPRQPIAYFHDGDTLINLDKPGIIYFITDDVNRCKQGITIMVEVTAVPSVTMPPETPRSAMAPSPSKSSPPENQNSTVAPSPSTNLPENPSSSMTPSPSPSKSSPPENPSSSMTPSPSKSSPPENPSSSITPSPLISNPPENPYSAISPSPSKSSPPENPSSSMAPSSSISNPPENPYSSMAPSPSQLVSHGGSPELSPAPSPSDSVVSFAVSKIVTALIVGLGLWALKE